jgi:catechol 2,3-dioxygenase-like lactoylglutathione lyase family enzyme
MDPHLSPPAWRLAIVALWASEVERAAHFYCDLIELALMLHHGTRPHADAGGTLFTLRNGTPHTAEEVEINPSGC